jgi:hypothetical protein
MGRTITYAFYDHHAASVLDEAVCHSEHTTRTAPA